MADEAIRIPVPPPHPSGILASLPPPIAFPLIMRILLSVFAYAIRILSNRGESCLLSHHYPDHAETAGPHVVLVLVHFLGLLLRDRGMEVALKLIAK